MISRHVLAPHTVLASVLFKVPVQMCNTSDWIHCNNNPTLHRNPQNQYHSHRVHSRLAKEERAPILVLPPHVHGKISLPLSAMGCFVYCSPQFLKCNLTLPVRKRLLTSSPFSRPKLFLLVSVANTAICKWYLREICNNQNR